LWITRGIVESHATDERSDRLHQARATDTTACRKGPFRRDEASVPAEDGVWSHDGCAVAEQLPANQLAPERQSTALVIVEAGELRTELLAEDAVLLAEVVKNPLLLSVEPASEAGEQEELGGDRPSHGPGRVSEVGRW